MSSNTFHTSSPSSDSSSSSLLSSTSSSSSFQTSQSDTSNGSKPDFFYLPDPFADEEEQLLLYSHAVYEYTRQLWLDSRREAQLSKEREERERRERAMRRATGPNVTFALPPSHPNIRAGMSVPGAGRRTPVPSTGRGSTSS